MSAKKISQREARRLRKRVKELEGRERDRLNAWGSEYTRGSMLVATFDLADWLKGRLWMAKQLNCVLVGKYVDEELKLFVVPREVA